MAAKRSPGRNGPSTAKTIAKITALILLAFIIIAGAVFGIFMGTNGFGGNYATFLTRINDNYIIVSGSAAVPRGSRIEVKSFSDYTFTVTAVMPQQGGDFEVTLGNGSVYAWSDFEGRDFTAGFTFTPTDDGAVVIDYGELTEILSAATGKAAALSGKPAGELFCLTVSSGNSVLGLNFELATMHQAPTGITLTPDYIVFYEVTH